MCLPVRIFFIYLFFITEISHVREIENVPSDSKLKVHVFHEIQVQLAHIKGFKIFNSG